MKEVNKETGRPLLEEEFDRLTTVRTMVLKSSFMQRVKLKGDSKKEAGESFQFDLFFWTMNRFKSVDIIL